MSPVFVWDIAEEAWDGEGVEWEGSVHPDDGFYGIVNRARYFYRDGEDMSWDFVEPEQYYAEVYVVERTVTGPYPETPDSRETSIAKRGGHDTYIGNLDHDVSQGFASLAEAQFWCQRVWDRFQVRMDTYEAEIQEAASHC